MNVYDPHEAQIVTRLREAERERAALRARLAELEAQLAAAPSGLRVAALDRRLRNAMAEAKIVAGKGDDPETRAELGGEEHGLRHALVMVKEHLGNPTPADRAAAEVLALDLAADLAEVEPMAPDDYLAEIRLVLSNEENDLRTALLHAGNLALAGIVACAAKGGA